MKKLIFLPLFLLVLATACQTETIDPEVPSSMAEYAISPSQVNSYHATVGVMLGDIYVPMDSFALSAKENYWIVQPNGKLFPDLNKMGSILEAPETLMYQGSEFPSTLMVGPRFSHTKNAGYGSGSSIESDEPSAGYLAALIACWDPTIQVPTYGSCYLGSTTCIAFIHFHYWFVQCGAN